MYEDGTHVVCDGCRCNVHISQFISAGWREQRVDRWDRWIVKDLCPNCQR